MNQQGQDVVVVLSIFLTNAERLSPSDTISLQFQSSAASILFRKTPAHASKINVFATLRRMKKKMNMRFRLGHKKVFSSCTIIKERKTHLKRESVGRINHSGWTYLYLVLQVLGTT